MAAVSPSSGIIRRVERWTLTPTGRVERMVRIRRSFDGRSTRTVSYDAIWYGSALRLVFARVASTSIGEDISLRPLPGPSGKTRCRLTFGIPSSCGTGVLEYEVVESVEKGALARLGFTPVRLFTHRETIGEDVFEVIVPKGTKLTYVARRMGAAGRPQEKSQGTSTLWTWVMTDVAPLPECVKAPNLYRRAPLVRASVLDDWRPVARWLSAMIRRNVKPSDSIRSRARTITKAEKPLGDWATLVKLQRWVSENLRHVDLPVDTAVDLGGNPAERVLARGFGDCVDRAIALSSLLSASGLEARPVFLCSRNYRAFDPEIPTLYCGDHCIVVVQGSFGTVFCDPGVRFVMPGCLPHAQQGVEAFDPLRCAFYRTPTSTAEENRLEFEEEIGCASNGEASATVTVRVTGEPERRLRTLWASLRNEREGVQLFKGLTGLPEETEFLSVEALASPNDLAVPFRLRGSYRLACGVLVNPSMLAVHLPLHRHRAIEFIAGTREEALCYRTPITISTRSRLIMPQGTNLVGSVPQGNLHASPCRYQRSCTSSPDGSVVLEEHYVRNAYRIEAKAYQPVKALIERRAAWSSRPLVFLASQTQALTTSLVASPKAAAVSTLPRRRGAQILLREVAINVDETGGWKLTRQELVVVHDEMGLRAGDMVLRGPASARLDALSVTVENARGQGSRTLNEKALSLHQRAPGHWVFSVTGLEPGGRFTWHVTMTVPAKDSHAYGKLDLTSRWPVELTRVQLTAGEGFKPSAALCIEGAEQRKLQATAYKGSTVLQGELNNVLSRQHHWLMFSTVPSWRALGKGLLKRKNISQALEYCTRLRARGLAVQLYVVVSDLARSCNVPVPVGSLRPLIESGGLWSGSSDGSIQTVSPVRLEAGLSVLALDPPANAPRVLGRQGVQSRAVERIDCTIAADGGLDARLTRTLPSPLGVGGQTLSLKAACEKTADSLSTTLAEMVPGAAIAGVDVRPSSNGRLEATISFTVPDYVVVLDDGGWLFEIPTLIENTDLKSGYSRRCSIQLNPKFLVRGTTTMDKALLRVLDTEAGSIVWEEEMVRSPLSRARSRVRRWSPAFIALVAESRGIEAASSKGYSAFVRKRNATKRGS